MVYNDNKIFLGGKDANPIIKESSKYFGDFFYIDKYHKSHEDIQKIMESVKLKNTLEVWRSDLKLEGDGFSRYEIFIVDIDKFDRTDYQLKECQLALLKNICGEDYTDLEKNFDALTDQGIKELAIYFQNKQYHPSSEDYVIVSPCIIYRNECSERLLCGSIYGDRGLRDVNLCMYK